VAGSLIDRVELFPVRLPYARAMNWASTRESGADFMILRLTTSEGLIGVSEGVVKTAWTGATLRSLAVCFEEIFTRMLIGLDPEDVGGTKKISRIRENNLAKAMIDVALWDLRSQLARRPLWRMWSGRQEIDMSWCVTRQAPIEMAREAEAALADHGFRTLKLKGGQGLDVDEAALQAVRRAVGDDIFIYVDANRAYSVSETARYVSMLSDYGVGFAEDPCRLTPGVAFGEIQRQCPLPLLVDGDCRNIESMRMFVESGAQAFNLKIQKAQGYTENWELVNHAREHGVQTNIGLFGESSLGAHVALQLASALPPGSLPAEVSGHLLFREEFVKTPVKIKNGVTVLPDQPGFAQLVDWEKVKYLRPA